MGIDCMDHPDREEEFRDDCRYVVSCIDLLSVKCVSIDSKC